MVKKTALHHDDFAELRIKFNLPSWAGKSPSEVNKALEPGRIPDLIVEFGLVLNFTCCEKLPKLLKLCRFSVQAFTKSVFKVTVQRVIYMQDLKQINFVTNFSREELRDTPTLLMFASKKIAFKFSFLSMIQIKRKPFINMEQAGEQARLSKNPIVTGPRARTVSAW